jgi:tetratricopeptide (TPR) repeat protein
MDLKYYLKKVKKFEEENKIDLAIEECYQCMKIYPNSHLLYQNLGDLIAKKIRQSQILPFTQIEYALNQPYTFDDVVKYYTKAIEINPSLSEIEKKLEEYIIFSKKYSEILIASQNKGIIVAGIPRCGTTLVFRALATLPKGNTTPSNYYGLIKKTHCLAPKSLPRGYKAVFMFGDVVRAVISTRKSRYEKNHFLNCGCIKNPEETNIYIEDALNYERMFDSWHQKHNYPVICLRFENLHKNVDILNTFLNTNVSLPEKIRRSTKYSDCSRKDLKQIKNTYQSLMKKVHSTPDISIY